MNHIMTFILFFSPEKMIYSHHLMYTWGQALSRGQALSTGNVIFLPFAFITFIWARPDSENSQGKS